MKDNTHKLINRETDQTGRPSYLAQYREYWCPKDRIEPLLVAPVNLSDWFPLFGGYIVRAFRTGEPTDKFDLPEPARQYIEQRLANLTTSRHVKVATNQVKGDKQLSRLLEKSDRPGLDLLSPASRLSKMQWGRACRLGSALMSLARRERYQVRSAVLGYCVAATTRRYVILTDKVDAKFGKQLIEVVRELHISDLKIHLVGFRVGRKLSDIDDWLRVLELPSTPVDFETANNTRSPARLNHVGIKVCWGASSRASQEWHEVALLAAITELWRSVTPSLGFELA
jgi:hypothetical protein